MTPDFEVDRADEAQELADGVDAGRKPRPDALETYVTGYQRVRLPNGREGVQPGPELAERLAAEQADRQRRASAAAEGLKLAARNDELAREVESLRNQPPDPAEVRRLRDELHQLRGKKLSLRAALDVMTSRVIELQNRGAESVPDDPELAALLSASTDPAAPRDGGDEPDVPGLEPELEELPPGPQAGVLPDVELP